MPLRGLELNFAKLSKEPAYEEDAQKKNGEENDRQTQRDTARDRLASRGSEIGRSRKQESTPLTFHSPMIPSSGLDALA